MALEDNESEVAETLYREWAADKQMKCLKRQLCRMAKALRALGEGIQLELELDPAHSSDLSGRGDKIIVEHVSGQKFTARPSAQVLGQRETQVLPTAGELADLLQGYRQACRDLRERRAEVTSL